MSNKDPKTGRFITGIVKSLEDRFWEKVDKKGPDDCWEWRGAKTRKGYGEIHDGDRTLRANRVSWEIANGPIPKGNGYHGTCVLHHCDNPGCVNPTHLFLGTVADNNHDREKKGRSVYVRGERQGSAKLTVRNIHTIRQMLRGGVSRRVIANKYGVAQCTIGDINTGRKWGWLKEDGEDNETEGRNG